MKRNQKKMSNVNLLVLFRNVIYIYTQIHNTSEITSACTFDNWLNSQVNKVSVGLFDQVLMESSDAMDDSTQHVLLCETEETFAP